MNDFDLKKYLADNKLHEEEMDLSYTELSDDEKDEVSDMMDVIYSKINPEGDMKKNTGLFRYIDAWFESKGDSLSENKLLKEEISLDAFLKNQLTGIEGETEGMETVEREEWLDMFDGTKNESGFDDIYNLIKNGKNNHSIDFGDFKVNYGLKLGDDKIIINYKVIK